MITAFAYFEPKISELGNIPGVTLCKTGWGETYCSVGGFDSKPHENIIKYADRIEAVCHFTYAQGLREKGTYRSGKITAELDRSIMDKDRDYVLRLKGQGFCLKEMEVLYHEIRAGNIKPSPRDSYEKDQCKEDPRFAYVIIKRFEEIFFKKYFFPGGFWREAVKIIKEAKSSFAT